MAETVTLKAESRSDLGTRQARRLRSRGLVPVVMLRKKEAPLHLLVPMRELELILKKGARIVDLAHPSGQDRVFIKEVQYDHFGDKIYHVDFAKVAMDELITLEVPLELKGKPVGVTDEGGVLDQYVKVLRISCLPTAIPEKIELDVAKLKKDEHLAVKDIHPPPGVKILNELEVVVAAVTEHKIEEIAPAVAATPGPAEPEVIKKEKAEDAAAEGEKGEKGEKKEPAPKKEKEEKDKK
ncbi:MAG TPA: 50S ribosomal protein L25 [Planctomycetota bacterium]|nr:50S ribosomal protein L25 [Planctomycetota bacterium]